MRTMLVLWLLGDIMDELDALILQTLQEDGRTPFTHIARQAGVSETTIRNRYHRLVERGILRAVGIVDPYVLGFQAPALIAISVEPGAIDEAARAIRELPEVSYMVLTLGSCDLMVEVLCRDQGHLGRLITQQIHRIPGIRSTETLLIAQRYNLTYRHAAELSGQVLEADA
jgi:Lrp/AsnC family transcriptional regulator for asnA, asnC and gidA